MCEQFIARAAEPFRLDELWPFAETLERFGIAGFGWGVAWLAGDGRLASYRNARAFRDDPGREAVGASGTTAALVHLRRPSRLSTLDSARHPAVRRPGRAVRVQPQRRPPGLRGSSSHVPCAGRIHGRADTEVGARWLEDAWRPGATGELLAALHDCFGGQANLAVLASDGTPYHYAGNGENPVFAFRLGRIGVASTGIHSLDRSLFRFVAPSASDRRLVPIRTTVALDVHGSLVPMA